MPDADAKRVSVRVLVLVSADFGELANALYLLDGTETSARILLPPRLQEHNPQLPPHSVAGYSGVAEVLAEMRHFRPRCLLLMSAYLFDVNGLLNTQALVQILNEAQTLSVNVATTDPFLGSLPSLPSDAFSVRGAAAKSHFAALQEVLRDVPHVYLSPMPKEHAGPVGLAVPAVSKDLAAKSFFNPRVIISPSDRASALTSLQQRPLRLDAPYWLFVLSSEDYRLQCGVHGKAGFDDMLLGIMQQGIAARRCVVLLAPAEVSESLAGRVPERARVMAFCDYRTFHALLLNAEHAFYWNVLSNSVLVRAVNGGSVFFMDIGHLARYIPSIFPLAMQSYYANAQLPMLDLGQFPDAVELARRAQAQPKIFAAAMTALQALPSPDELLSSLAAATSK